MTSDRPSRADDASRDFHRPPLSEEYVAIVSESPDGIPSCSISPPPTTSVTLGDEWVLARGDAFAGRTEIR
jgi:hypothetical protein